MKKIIKPSILIAFIISAPAFTTPGEKKKVEIKESTITWKGKKLIGKTHTGTINLKEGHFEYDGNSLAGGHFVVDMTSITNTDLSGKYKEKLENHLKSDDFFGVDAYPTASFTITGATPSDDHYKITGDITIKGITNQIEFDLYMKENSSNALIEIDRSKYDVRFGSGSFFDNLGDKAISDIIELNIALKH